MSDTHSRPSPEAVASVVAALAQRFESRCVTSQAVRDQHAHTLTWLKPEPPDAVVFPRTTAEVQEIVRLCAAHRVPMIPFGTGSSLEGQVNAPFGGISIDTREMNRILTVHAADLDVVLEPGVTRTTLNSHLRDAGLFFPIDPGFDASFGGMAATRASGTNAVRYGTMKDNVLALQAVLANGEVVTTARRAKKSSAGYDLTRLLVGSEGTLGVITELTIKLAGIPDAISAGICPFPSVEAACEATIATIQHGIPVARIELLDEVAVAASNRYSKLELPVTPMLFLEFHGTGAGVAEQARLFGEIAADLGGGPFDWATEPERRSKLWQARHDAFWAALALRPGCAGLSGDVCVPISRLADCVAETKRDVEAFGLTVSMVGHVGDGNFHALVVLDNANADEVGRCKAFLGRLVERAIAMEGTCTGEHGVGQGKMGYIESELGLGALDAMRSVKRALDPLNLMNPGKIFRL
ncbi:FAD-binding oxidoreductase [Blastochloris viridis]|uniref:D-lactate dehydrogenase (cytochrome) n=1 Tax=Blastochloris viridis TaxID=1079 RepID=A0A0H5BEP9_BLAVI|nr:FAD-linked oxidase C-terminal domain-containing protein [Blastochloris viridis]ALK10494.1 putative FAD-linked oxidoreductase [Blastochloris viridis]BAR99559.1 D-Lactate dehydrogenase [Blastochloris viridis]CUU43156.1 putative FAD-linked oxidoreductase [Blastochloris viridis]